MQYKEQMSFHVYSRFTTGIVFHSSFENPSEDCWFPFKY